MSRKFKLWTDPYDAGMEIFRKKNITIEPGVTVLVGCNGIGKSTMLHCIEEQLKKEGIPYIHFDNLHDGGKNSISEASFMGDFKFMATAATSSEGENIMMNINKLAERIGNLVRTGKDGSMENQIANIFKSFHKDSPQTETESNERWILLDAIDSGFSVDNIVDLKEFLFKTILKHNFEKEIYIIISANEYEMANGEMCFDVYNGEHITFDGYNDYRNFILNSRKDKDKRGIANG